MTQRSAPIKMWLVLRWPHDLRFFAPLIGTWVARGHQIEVSIAATNPQGNSAQSLQALTEVMRNASGGPAPRIDWLTQTSRSRPRRAGEALQPPASRSQGLLRTLRNLRSYAERAPGWNPVLRFRWRGYLPKLLRGAIRITERLRMRALIENPVIGASLAALDRALPPPRTVTERLRAIRPDVVVVSPMLYPEMPEVEVLKAARRAKIPTLGFVLSWDNLTSKGSFPVRPDRLLVWNDVQRREAAELHRFSAQRVEVVGAPVFDYLFDPSYGLGRGEWLRRAGIPESGCYVTYAVSSRVYGLGGELELVRRLAAAIAREWPRNEGRPWILVRPHPRNAEGWRAFSEQQVAVWPSLGFPESEEARIALRNTLAHSDAVVGINTSLFVEAAAIDRPCISLAATKRIEVPYLEHFRYLLDAGFLHLPEDEAQAARLVGEIQRHGDPHEAERRAFVESFVRPGGRGRAAADVAAQRIADLAQQRPVGEKTNEWIMVRGSA